MKPTLLTVDWDFFIYNPNELDDATFVVHPGTPQQREMNGKMIFDWTGSESQSLQLNQLLWAARATICLRLGLDIQQIMSIHADKNCTPVDTFIAQLENKLHLGDAPQLIGDSHAFGWAAGQQVWSEADPPQPIRVINFDAHHDLGYPSNYIEIESCKGIADCGSWLFHLLRLEIADEVIIIYPDWKGKREWSTTEKSHHLKPYLDKVRVFTWSDWLQSECCADSSIDLIYQCRSSAWTPPWMDNQFVQLYMNMPSGDMTCIDCTDYFGQNVGDNDACTCREWNPDEAKQILSILEE